MATEKKITKKDILAAIRADIEGTEMVGEIPTAVVLEFIDKTVAQIDVKASVDKPVYVIPSYSTFEKPPVVSQAYRVAKFDMNSRSWSVVDDYRGIPVVNKTTKEKITWTKLGNLPKEYTFKTYDDDLEKYVKWDGLDWTIDDEGRTLLLADIWSIRKSIRELECSSDIEYNGNLIHVDPASFNDIMLAAQEAILSGDMTTSKRWVTADNVDVQLNGNDFIAIARLFGARRQKLVYESNEAWQRDEEESTDSLIEIYREMREQRG
jgi:hypothetical protein